MWEQSMEGMMGLIMKSSPSGYTYIAERTSRDAIKKKVYEKQHWLVGFYIIQGKGGYYARLTEVV